ncbi:MAG: class I SAM-dependent methyltransferase [Anaerolineae bacterium]|jgi:hypothetical protein|nr:class I SAM-dependent methyltransferase [Candidatus Jacksonbacteria bacterium]MBT7070405.1 class I SAM-dependent methyltransferase [Anaerolineae bacterium]MBT7601159.1 class I SAM-dependent methyltransferase [Anaerolineae bacterium]MBT7990596.1 class I SAM-dependent methyltransferase [Anaerolineae bacterium]
MKLKYLIPRLARHFLPEKLVRFLLLRGWIIRPGIETQSPEEAAERTRLDLEEAGVDLHGKSIMIFGYGGRFAFGVALLKLGAAHVILCDKFAPPDDTRNRNLLQTYREYLQEEQGRVTTRPAWITLIEDDIRSVAERSELSPVDIIISSSVYEHLDEVDSITASLASITKPEGVHLHYVDLRDHYFKYPFEMLCYSAKVWYGWLNPSSHHNRFRVWDYQRVFEKYFDAVELTVVERDEAAFEATRPRIQPEFISGNLDDDSVTLIKVITHKPVL